MTSYHTVPAGLVSSLAGAGDHAEIELLHAGQLSRRLVQLRVILDLARKNAPESADTAGLWNSFVALAEVQRHDPTTVASLLSGPQAGAWAARCLRLLTERPGEAPLWVDLAHLGSLAVAAGIRSGVPVTATVPVRASTVSLPTLGRASVDRPGSWGLAVCESGDPIRLDGSPPSRWSPIPLLETDTLTVPLDNVDPYWAFGSPVLTTLDDAAVAWWRQQLADTCAIIARRHHDWSTTLTAAVRCLVPLASGGRFGGASGSSKDAPGAVALTEPVRPDRFAATLLHEVQHFRLNAVHDMVPLHEDAKDLLYSPWRNDPRGLPGLLHGTVAFMAVADFWGRERATAGRAADLTYARTVLQLDLACQALAKRSDLTPTGVALRQALTAATGRFSGAVIDEDVGRLAADLVAQHRALWRLRNVVPEARATASAERWLLGEPATTLLALPDRVAAVAQPGGDSPLFRVAVAWLDDPGQVRTDAASTETFSERYPGADVADMLLLAGDYRTAFSERLEKLTDGVTTPECWAALSVAHGRVCGEPGTCPLVVRPELVRAAWSRVTAAARNPAELLLSGHMAGTSTSDSIRR